MVLINKGWIFCPFLLLAYRSSIPHTPPGRQARMGGESRKQLGEDIIKLCILPRLPTKDLLRFQCVSKGWHSLISSDPYFIHLHSPSIRSSILFMESHKRDGKFRVVFIAGDPRSSGFPSLPFPNEMYYRTPVASCNGLICLDCNVGDLRKLYIGNPILRDWRLLPHLDYIRDLCTCSGLAVDVDKSGVSYKLVVAETIENDDDEPMETIFKVLSSRSGQWEVSKYKLDISKSKCTRWAPRKDATYVNGVLYWICEPQMLWFDTKDGRCDFFLLPPDTNHEYFRGRAGVCNGELTYTRVSKKEMQIWSAADHQSAWTKIHSICIKTMVPRNSEVFGFFSWRCFSCRLNYPMPFDGGNVVFFRLDGNLFSYDMETGVAERKVHDGDMGYFLTYKHCLTPLPSL